MIARRILANAWVNTKVVYRHELYKGVVSKDISFSYFSEAALFVVLYFIAVTYVENNDAFVTQFFLSLFYFLLLSGGALLMAVALTTGYFREIANTRVSKMIFTKPCSPEIWLFSIHLTYFARFCRVGFYFFLLFLALSLTWRLPAFETLLFGYVYFLLISVMSLSYFTGVLAILGAEWGGLACIVGFAPLSMFVGNAIDKKLLYDDPGQPWRFLYYVFGKITDFFYTIAPDLIPHFSQVFQAILTMRVTTDHWLLLAVSAFYIIPVSAGYFILGAYFIRRRDHS